MFRNVIAATCAILITAALYLWLQDFLKDVPTTKVVAGTLESVTVSRGLIFSDSDTSELVLSDGTHVTVKGAVDVWRRGSEVVHLVPVGEKADNRNKADNKWCIGDECFWQK
ncbi:hypothetical protein ACKVM9_002200 [Pantoea agglomerans]|uniref:hypothetical protein n=1 Tax=Enterobacter agglomerans TaxID=549 RepID=UPI00390A92AB